MRLIDADELTKKVNHILASQFITGGSYVLDEIINAIKTMPTVKQEHGHWIARTDFGNGCREIRCSECGETGFWRNQPLYCPHCGAKMDGDSE